MGFGALKKMIRPLSRTLITCTSNPSTTTPFLYSYPSLKPEFRSVISNHSHRQSSWTPMFRHFNSLTDTRFPKRRPVDKPRRKRAGMKPPGPYAWVPYVPGQPISPNNPNEGSVKRRNEKKRIKQRRAFILVKKKRKAQLQQATRKKNIKKVERKMAAVARERAWAERLAELQRLEEEKKKSMA
ncbi:hypothetical protein CFOL_v3_15692 [Cephalotus follicularis]|uniref:Uncharacterized protein n=1 Tax=Cephalotus follicularis TaxID=3775 RepID=A0A1Q3BWN5_CEPFO|nr:hypothetical protein CFOL_v3_15692 [Cephalotus follicularis]